MEEPDPVVRGEIEAAISETAPFGDYGGPAKSGPCEQTRNPGCICWSPLFTMCIPNPRRTASAWRVGLQSFPRRAA